jgi:hypothetical protein
MKYDDIHQHIGSIGVFQVCVVIAMSLFCMFTCDSITMIFVGAEMPHWCRIERLEHLPFERQKYIGIPYTEGTPGQEYDQEHLTYSSCQMFALNYSALTDEELKDWNRTLLLNESTPTVDCKQWIYEQTTFVSTIVSRVRFISLCIDIFASFVNIYGEND